VELACRHLACKRCANRLSECPSCDQKTASIGWNNRFDVREIQKSCKELMDTFEKERLQMDASEAHLEPFSEPSTEVIVIPQRKRNSCYDSWDLNHLAILF